MGISEPNLNKAVGWQYPVKYGKENEADADILNLGGRRGSHAAKRGAEVVLIDKGAVIRSGSGGVGVNRWQGADKLSEMMEGRAA